MTLDQYFTKQLRIFSNIHSQQTLRTKKSYYDKYIAPRFGDKELQNILGDDLQEFVNDLMETKSKKGTFLAPKTIENIFDILSVLFNKAIKNRLLKYNPCDCVELPKYDNTVYFSMPEDKIRDLINSVLNFEEPVYRGIFLFLLHGRRLNEVLSITWADIDLSLRLYSIPYKINKTRRNMRYRMTEKLYQTLLFQYQNNFSSEPKDYVFVNPSTMNKFKDIRRAWKRLLKKADIENMRIHDIRHLVGFYSINYLNIPIEHVSFTLGHSDIRTTQKYINIKPEIAKDVISSIFDSF